MLRLRRTKDVRQNPPLPFLRADFIGDEKSGQVKSVSRECLGSVTRAEWQEAFDADFWPLYPRKVCKAQAITTWHRVEPRDQETLDAICVCLEKYVAHWREEGTERRFIPHASTWLNQQRWLDEEVG